MKATFYFVLTNLAVLAMMSFFMSALAAFGIRIDQASMMGLLVMAAVMGSIGSLISLLLSKKMALRSVGGQIIETPRNEAEAWLFDTVGRLSKEWGFDMPDIAIYDSPEPNAFATGANKNKSLVAVSTGLLRGMTRDEVEGVLGHELAHVGNGDMVAMGVIQGVLNTFVIFLASVAANVLASAMSGSDDNRDSRPNPLIYYTAYSVLQVAFGALASLVSMWFSRRREYRADLGSARHVGAPKMIAALKRLQAMQSGTSDVPRDVAVLAISAPEKDGLMSTHPTLANRIHRLEHEFRG